MRGFHRLTTAVAGGLLLLAGCGGDGDGSPEISLTAITEANAAQVSSVVYQAASVLFEVASSSSALPLGTPTAASAGGSGGRLGLAGFAGRQLKSGLRRPLAAGSGAAGPVHEQTVQCTGGGSVKQRMEDADNNGVESVGDSLTLTFTGCVEDGVTSNGTVSFRLTLLSDASVGAQVAFGNLELNDGSDLIVANGGVDLTVTQQVGVSEVYAIAGSSLSASVNGDVHTLTGFEGTATTDHVVGTVTYTFSGRVSDSSNRIVVDAQTVSAFVAQLTDDFPGSGTFRSTGAANSQALLQAVSPTLVRISADPEGDGSFTAPVDWSWSALEALPG
jgi:hypothetical protein